MRITREVKARWELRRGKVLQGGGKYGAIRPAGPVALARLNIVVRAAAEKRDKAAVTRPEKKKKKKCYSLLKRK